MPPWKADPEFQTFRNEKILAPGEIDLIQEWVKAGMSKGKKVKSKKGPVRYQQGSSRPDLSLPMTTTFTISDKAIEEFRFFVMPTGLKSNTYISAIEFMPGNRKQVHHSRVMVDTTQRIRGIDGMSELDPRVKEFQTIPLVDEFLYGWVPGNNKIFFPPGTGKLIHKDADLILNIHYSPSSKVQQDKSTINLYFAEEEVQREVQTLTLRENHIINQPFFIPAESIPTFRIDYQVEKDISLISVLPHMHFIGRSFKALATTPTGETIPLIKIDDWDFNWQTTYQFKNLIKIPAGSRIKVEAKYDNSSENPANPFNPARDIGYGWDSTSEMCNLVIYYINYENGDEKLEY
jgi:hypothetical protein